MKRRMGDSPEGFQSEFIKIAARHDAEIHSLNVGLSDLRGDLNVGLSDLRDAVNNLNDHLQGAQKINWQAIGVFLTVWALSFSPLIYGFQMNKSHIEENRAILLSRADVLGRADERLNALEREMFGSRQ